MKKPTPLADARNGRPTHLPKAALHRIQRLLGEAQSLQGRVSEAVCAALEAMGYDPDVYQVNSVTGYIALIEKPAAITPESSAVEDSA